MFAKGGDKAKAKREERARAKAAKKGVSEGDLFTPDPQIEGEGEGSSSSNKLDTKQSTSTSTSAPSSTTNKGKQQPSPGYFHTVPSLPPSLPTASTSKSISTIPNPLFPFPQTQQQTANLQTFQSLSSLQYRMGLGPRFGGEYLIYPGDYLRYHAHFTSQVVRGDEFIKPMEIVAWGRLGTGTKKAGLICCVSSESERSELDEQEEKERSERGDRMGDSEHDLEHEDRHDEEKGGVEFYSLEWANFG
jgi:tRNA-splicing endonuclease subunit Sen34